MSKHGNPCRNLLRSPNVFLSKGKVAVIRDQVGVREGIDDGWLLVVISYIRKAGKKKGAAALPPGGTNLL